MATGHRPPHGHGLLVHPLSPPLSWVPELSLYSAALLASNTSSRSCPSLPSSVIARVTRPSPLARSTHVRSRLDADDNLLTLHRDRVGLYPYMAVDERLAGLD